MKQAIIRVATDREDAELLISEDDQQIWKHINIEELRNLLNDFMPKGGGQQFMPRLIDKRIIAEGRGVILFRETEHQRLVFYGGRSYRINYPNCLYEVRYSGDRIDKIDCYTWFKWSGIYTVLYLFPMPNMMSGASMCIGTADRAVIDGKVIEAVERIVDAEYTHDHVDNLCKPQSTVKWFRHLKKDRVQSSDLKKPVKKLYQLVDLGEMNADR